MIKCNLLRSYTVTLITNTNSLLNVKTFCVKSEILWVKLKKNLNILLHLSSK